MKIKYTEFILTPDTDGVNITDTARRHNGAVLAEGLKGIPCISVTKDKPEDIAFVKKHFPNFDSLVPAGTWIGTIEWYENGSMNMFVKNSFEYGKSIGVITIRPS